MATPGEAECAVLGRRVELAAFQGLLDDLAGGRGRCVLVEGEPGIGKTALLHAVLAQARAREGIAVCAAACEPSARRSPLSVIFQALGADPQAAPSPGPSAAPNPLAAYAVERVVAHVERFLEKGPLLVAVDDLHVADDASLLAWQRLYAVSTRAPLLLVAALRPVPRRPPIDRLRRILKDHAGLTVRLDRLEPEEVAALAGRILGARPGPRLVERLESAGGNPLFARELVDALVGAGAVAIGADGAELVDVDAGADAAAEVRPDGLVDTLAVAVADRLGFLGADTLDVLRTAALLGHEFTVTDLSAALGRPAGLLSAAVQEAVAAGVVEAVGVRLRFCHGVMRQALFESIPGPERVALRRATIHALMETAAPVDRVAELLLADLGTADGWETEWVARHAATLCQRAPETAALLFEHVLTHPDIEPRQRHVLLEWFASLCFTLGRYERTVELCRQVLDGARAPESRGKARWLQAHSLARLGRLAEAERAIELAEADPGLPEFWRARLAVRAAMNLLAEGRHAAAGAAAVRVLAWGERLPDLLTIGYALHVDAAVRFSAGDVSGSLVSVERALNTIGSLPRIADLRATLSAQRVSALIELDRFDEAAVMLRNARAQAELIGSTRLAGHADAAAELAYQQGRWNDALAETGATGAAGAVGAGRGIAALIAVRRDDERTAARCLKALSEEPSPVSADTDFGYALLARAGYEERGERLDRAIDLLRVALEEPSEHSARLRTILLPTLIRLALAAGDEALAKSAAEASSRQSRLPRSAAVAQWCKGLVDADAGQVAAAVDYLRSVGRVPELAQALEDLADLRARDGDEAAARTDFGDALAISTQLGAAWDARRAVARLRTHGIRAGTRSRNRPRTGPEALTETEQRVAELVGRGMSNPDIAEHLSLSRRTVETHVSHILAKLGAGSRREIAELLRRE